MRVVLSSIFRDSTGYLPRYFSQIAALREHADVRLVLGEGDSSDGTGAVLGSYLEDWDSVVTHNHGGPRYGSIDHPQRWANIAGVVRDVVRAVADPGDAFVWVESDLVWDPLTMMELLKADRPVAPMVFAADTPRFYDTWGYRKGGQMFLGHPPYLPGGPQDERYVPIDSCGSCFVVPARDFPTVRDWDGMWPFPAGGRLVLDTASTVRHP